jgi:hypothetical protein
MSMHHDANAPAVTPQAEALRPSVIKQMTSTGASSVSPQAPLVPAGRVGRVAHRSEATCSLSPLPRNERLT